MASITITTPVGPFTIVARGDTVVAAGFTDALPEPVPMDGDVDRPAKAVRAYFDGDLTAIDEIAVEQPGAPFLTAAWAALRAVPPGAPVTYTTLARLAGRPAAVRAAAQACARNAVGLFVPCHRVVRTDGALGGYRWGMEIKRWLLTHESETGSSLSE
jgi:methylated-DNA-[protein]-cysteine S-methyltransferase